MDSNAHRSKHAKWSHDLQPETVDRAYELNGLLNAFVAGKGTCTEATLYGYLYELADIVAQSKGLERDWVHYDDVVQDTVTYVMAEKRLIFQARSRSWRHLLATVMRRPLERIAAWDKDRDSAGQLARCLNTDGAEGLRLLPDRVTYLLRNGSLLLLSERARPFYPEVARHIDRVVADVTVHRPRYRDMIHAYRILSRTARGMTRERLHGEPAT